MVYEKFTGISRGLKVPVFRSSYHVDQSQENTISRNSKRRIIRIIVKTNGKKRKRKKRKEKDKSRKRDLYDRREIVCLLLLLSSSSSVLLLVCE